MGSKDKQVRLNQKAFWEEKLSQRLAELTEMGLAREEMAKDTAVRQIRASLREAQARLTTIGTLEKKAEDMATAKAEKLAAPKKEKGKKKTKEEEEKEATSKRQQKKKQKKEGKEKGA